MTAGVPGLSLRAAGPGDLEVVRRLLRESGLPVDGLEEQFGESYVVASAGSAVVGAEGIERYGSAGLLRSAVVDRAWRGQGVGDLLTRDRIDWARSAGIVELWLLTTTAAGWFPRFGFERAVRGEAPAAVRASREFVEACPASAVAMKLTL
ncbi:MAG: arsenic resistance N-acetyltransferase ArsN2 [Gemmatimonadota bacterium]